MGINESVKMKVEVGDLKKEIDIHPNETILEACLREGIEVPFSCRSGACQACKGLLHSGQVAMEINEVLSADEIASGFVLCCQAKPISEEEITVQYLEA